MGDAPRLPSTSSVQPTSAREQAADPHPLCTAWCGLWAAHPADVGEHWSVAHCTFVPYDSTAIVDGRIAIVTYLAQRYARTRLVAAHWKLAAAWREGDSHVVAAELAMTTAPPQGAPHETRLLRLLAAGELENGAWRLRHVSEAMPAVLLEAIGGYEREAREAKQRPDVSAPVAAHHGREVPGQEMVGSSDAARRAPPAVASTAAPPVAPRVARDVASNDDRAVVERLVHDYIALSKGMQFDAKRAFWDTEEVQPLLAPEEAAAPLVGWEAIERYWSASRGAMKDLATDCFDVHVNLLSPGVALAVFRQRWVATMAGPDYLARAPLASTVRATFVLRARTAGWRLCASVEAHVDGVAYFRQLYEARANSER